MHELDRTQQRTKTEITPLADEKNTAKDRDSAPLLQRISVHDLMEFEKNSPHSLGAKEEAIRAQFGVSPIRYYQRLNKVIDTAEAMRDYPLLTKRLRTRRDSRARRREQADNG